MNILHIDETFHPAFGYQCNPLAKFQGKQGHNVTVLTVEARHLYPVYREFGDFGEHLDEQDRIYSEETGVRVIRVPARGYFAGRLVYKFTKLFDAIDRINPDVMMVHCFETITAVSVLFRYSNKVPMVFDSHMLSMASKNPFSKLYEMGMRRFVTPMLKKGGHRVIKTQDDDYVSTHLGVPESLTRYISFGTDTDLFSVDREAKSSFLRQHGLSDESFVVVSTGKLSEAKDGMLLAKAVKKKFATTKPVVIVVVANLDGEYERQVSHELNGSENTILFYPVQNYTHLPYFYQIADACVFPKQCSMSFFDAQACGTPVISEDNNINRERNSHNNGICFMSGDAESLRDAITWMASLSMSSYKAMRHSSRQFIERNFDYEKIAQKYTEELESAISRFGRK